jgi:hypothetical protein
MNVVVHAQAFKSGLVSRVDNAFLIDVDVIKDELLQDHVGVREASLYCFDVGFYTRR